MENSVIKIFGFVDVLLFLSNEVLFTISGVDLITYLHLDARNISLDQIQVSFSLQSTPIVSKVAKNSLDFGISRPYYINMYI